MTSLPASHFRLSERGLLKEGYYADINVFKPDALEDNATWAKPHQLAGGINALLVNGTPVILDGNLTGKRTGKILRHGN